MDVQVAEQGSCRRILTIKLAPDDIRATLDEVYKAASSQAQLPGFRPGKVPRKVLQKRFGDQIEAQARERLIGDHYNRAVADASLDVVSPPKLEGFDHDQPIDPSTDLEFEVHVDVRPSFELGDVTGIEIEGQDSAVTDEDVDNTLQELASQKRTLETVEEPVQDGDFVVCDLAFKNEAGDGVGERSGQQLNTAIPVAGTDPELFAAKLREQEAGAELSMELTFPDTFENEEVRGQKGTVDIKVNEVKRVVPAPIDDDLAKGFEFEDLETMKSTMREQIGKQKADNEKNRREEAILDKIMDAHPFDLPESMVERECDSLLQDFAQRMKQSGVDEDQAKERMEGERPNALTLAQKRVRAFFLIEAIAKKEKIFVTESDIAQEIAQVAAQHNVEPDVVRAHYEEQDMLGQVRAGVRDRKVRDFLTSKAKISDNTGTVEA